MLLGANIEWRMLLATSGIDRHQHHNRPIFEMSVQQEQLSHQRADSQLSTHTPRTQADSSSSRAPPASSQPHKPPGILAGAKADRLSVHVASWNVGNATPPANLHPWVPSGGGGCDIIAVCGQEATYKVKAVRERALGRFTGTIISGTDTPTCAHSFCR